MIWLGIGQEWRRRANCRGIGPDPFFPENMAGTNPYSGAVAFCWGSSDGSWPECPVRQECLDDALASPETMKHGYRGGMTPRERWRLSKAAEHERRREIGQIVRVRSAAGTVCGTEAGWVFHQLRGESCEVCSHAHRKRSSSDRATKWEQLILGQDESATLEDDI